MNRKVRTVKFALITVDLLIAVSLYWLGRYFTKSKNTERSILFLSGDYSGLNTEKICKVVGKRIRVCALLFLFGGIIDFVQFGKGITIASIVFFILLISHLIDMTINRNRKYRV